ncbi:MAG: MerR family transcriptional regulator [Rhodospirillales bacterium]|nr:MerR family transcriptional regulator [Rhodospirillales bacterium]
MDKFLSVDELATAGSTTTRTVRLYIDKGLLVPMRIGRTYCFPEKAKGALQEIKRAKRLGFSLDEIRTFQNGRNVAVMKGAIKRIEELIRDGEAEVSQLRHRLAHSNDKEKAS